MTIWAGAFPHPHTAIFIEIIPIVIDIVVFTTAIRTFFFTKHFFTPLWFGCSFVQSFLYTLIIYKRNLYYAI